MKFKELKSILSVTDEYKIKLEDKILYSDTDGYKIKLEDKILYCDDENIGEMTEENNLDDKEVTFIKAINENFLYIRLR